MDSDKNHVTYSTCYSESNTGLIYYTYRHYAPRLHKWTNKDPIAESGGLNLYQMVGNIPIGRFDILGSDYASLLNGVYKKLDSALFLKDAYTNWISWKGERMSVSLADIISDDARNPTSYSGYVADSESICIFKSNKSVSYSQGFGTRGLFQLLD